MKLYFIEKKKYGIEPFRKHYLFHYDDDINNNKAIVVHAVKALFAVHLMEHMKEFNFKYLIYLNDFIPIVTN